VLGRNLASLVGELPRRIGEDGGEAPALCETQKLSGGIDARSGSGFSGAKRNVEQFRLTGVFRFRPYVRHSRYDCCAP